MTSENIFFLKITLITVYSFVFYSTIIYLLRPSIADISTRAVYFLHETLFPPFCYSKHLYLPQEIFIFNMEFNTNLHWSRCLIVIPIITSYEHVSSVIQLALFILYLCLSLHSLKFHALFCPPSNLFSCLSTRCDTHLLYVVDSATWLIQFFFLWHSLAYIVCAAILTSLQFKCKTIS